MTPATLKLVTIIAEPVLESRIVRDLSDLGARGYTLSKVHGEGSRGVRVSDWEGGGNVKIETIVSPAVANRILRHVADDYFEHYAVIAYVADVQVVRGDKYI
jgi:nitrogen regulatory protein P-II 2